MNRHKWEIISSCQDCILIRRRNNRKGNFSLGEGRLWRWPHHQITLQLCFRPKLCVFRHTTFMPAAPEEKVLLNVQAQPSLIEKIFSSSPVLFYRVSLLPCNLQGAFTFLIFFFSNYVQGCLDSTGSLTESG